MTINETHFALLPTEIAEAIGVSDFHGLVNCEVSSPGDKVANIILSGMSTKQMSMLVKWANKNDYHLGHTIRGIVVFKD